MQLPRLKRKWIVLALGVIFIWGSIVGVSFLIFAGGSSPADTPTVSYGDSPLTPDSLLARLQVTPTPSPTPSPSPASTPEPTQELSPVVAQFVSPPETHQPAPAPQPTPATEPTPKPVPTPTPTPSLTHTPSWAVDQVTFWFFAFAGFTPTEDNLAVNREVCSATPHIVFGYWNVTCANTGGIYLVDDIYGNVSPENAAAKALVPTLASAAAIQLAWEWMKSEDSYFPYDSMLVGSPTSCKIVGWNGENWWVACQGAFFPGGRGTWLTMCVFDATLIVTGCTEGVDY